MTKTWILLRRLACKLPADDRREALAAIALAERLTVPPPGIRYGTYPDDQERRRRALLPRPNQYYPGERDFQGRAA